MFQAAHDEIDVPIKYDFKLCVLEKNIVRVMALYSTTSPPHQISLFAR